VAEYQERAYQVIDRLFEQGKVPILVGGSGLYAESVLLGYQFGEEKSRKQLPRYQSLKIGIDVSREELHQRIAKRTVMWVEQGLLEEISELLRRGVSPVWLESLGQEYRFFTRHLKGEISLDEAIAHTNISLHQFIKRQYTWWRRHNDVVWVKGEEEALRLSKQFLGADNC
jgi:tRNA A37 N6-isopentenylltransferase MiaA